MLNWGWVFLIVIWVRLMVGCCYVFFDIGCCNFWCGCIGCYFGLFCVFQESYWILWDVIDMYFEVQMWVSGVVCVVDQCDVFVCFYDVIDFYEDFGCMCIVCFQVVIVVDVDYVVVFVVEFVGYYNVVSSCYDGCVDGVDKIDIIMLCVLVCEWIDLCVKFGGIVVCGYWVYGGYYFGVDLLVYQGVFQYVEVIGVLVG